MPKGHPRFPEGIERKRLATIAMNRRPDIIAKRAESNRRRIARGIDPLRAPGVQERAARARIGGRRSAETKAKMSASRVRVMTEIGFRSRYPLPGAKQRGARRYARSAWEMDFARRLATSPRVLAWTYEPLSVRYDDEGVIRSTVPDFLVERDDGRRVLVEIKAAWAVERARLKLDACRARAKAERMAFVVLTEVELKCADPLALVLTALPEPVVRRRAVPILPEPDEDDDATPASPAL